LYTSFAEWKKRLESIGFFDRTALDGKKQEKASLRISVLSMQLYQQQRMS